MLAQTGGQAAGNDGDAEHDGESDDVLAVVDFEGEARRDEEEVEQRDAQERREQRRRQAERNGDEQHGKQEQHDDVGEVKDIEQRCRDDRGRRARQDGQRHAL